ncbi:MAG: isoaspartyl peptidase/L-asparaginase [Amoebophilaceae bacterium TMED152]|nr:beta-aspartyl-peptidase [Gammaproteobacteria bacterium]RPH02222.1 MAG: isoaspartyl peptidase/L-asparaginase [Amoebophilaceae bacterium TMED152]
MQKFFIALILFFSSFLFSNSKPVAIVVHGGAGWFENMPEGQVEGIMKGLEDSMNIGYEILVNGGSSLDAVEQAIIHLENDPLFNAGKGAVYTSELRQELDASIMYGLNNDAGAVASVTNVKNPISLARYVMENTDHVMFSSRGAERVAKDAGLDIVYPSYFYQKDRLDDAKRIKKEKNKMGTVGVVAIDMEGNITAGTSTGGMTNKMPGRIGDSPIIGAGTWAENNVCGVSATGHGEYFIRFNVANEICDLIKYQSKNVNEAAEIVIEKLKSIGADGGVIVLDSEGNAAMTFNTPAMARAYKNSKGEELVKIYKD